jgi:hypothetical protein
MRETVIFLARSVVECGDERERRNGVTALSLLMSAIVEGAVRHPLVADQRTLKHQARHAMALLQLEVVETILHTPRPTRGVWGGVRRFALGLFDLWSRG